LRGKRPGPTVAVIGELDSLRVLEHPHADPETGAAHACGHHCQIGMMLGAAVGLMIPDVLGELSGNVALIAVPAEEFIDVEYRWNLHKAGRLGLMAGKQEFIRLGAFDDVDMAMMVHTSASPEDKKFAVGGTSNGHVVKYVRFIGKPAHAGGAPHLGVNALQAAMLALNALNTQRETLRNEDTIRLHGILTRGGASVNSIPADVRYEGRVRGRNAEVITDANMKMDRCLRAGALAMGAKVEIVTIPGYLPMINDQTMAGLFKQNAAALVGEANIATHPANLNRGGSTDMGDLSQIMPVIHPYTGAATGTGHGTDYLIQDYEQAVIAPAKAMAMTVIDLLYGDAEKAEEVLAKSAPPMTKQQYLSLQNSRLVEELYEGK
ncbi:MAG: M20/M25/M40 family metallo-hydrolase, partial [Chloroflexi bacterium]|nr:M20/M25/M40 family metallo-hydrolase [Chloroflexota bacterium]